MFISHRLMQIFNSLVSMQNNALQDFQQANINQTIIQIFNSSAFNIN